MSKNIQEPVIRSVPYGNYYKDKLEEVSNNEKDKQLIFCFPTVYIIVKKKRNGKYNAYVGETNDILRRTEQHLRIDPKEREDFRELIDSSNGSKDPHMWVIGHEHFNKSMTLDIENLMMMYLSSDNSIENLNNRRTNEQEYYYTRNEMPEIFDKIWTSLNSQDNKLFPIEKIIRNSAIFKSSPFHKLTYEQIKAKEKIEYKIYDALKKDKDGQLILVEGAAGTGKTVVLSTLFYELNSNKLRNNDENPSAFLVVNQEEQVKIYEQIAHKLRLNTISSKDIVSKPTRFINQHKNEKVDVLLIDEAHLLLTQKNQAYNSPVANQLKDLMNRAKVVVAVFDPKQILRTDEYVSPTEITRLENNADAQGNLITLKNQMRIDAGNQTINWIKEIINNGKIMDIPNDNKYKVKIGKTPESVHEEIKKHNTKDETNKSGISRMLATFDWPYSGASKPKNDDYWRVKIGNWSLPWNLQLPTPRGQKKLAWAEQSQTIDEVGSIYTIQGFDLNYAGIILGPSVKYRDGKVRSFKEYSSNKKVTNNRKMNGESIDVSDTLLKNELNTLLARGVHGLFIYAVDDELREQLLKYANEDHILF